VFAKNSMRKAVLGVTDCVRVPATVVATAARVTTARTGKFWKRFPPAWPRESFRVTSSGSNFPLNRPMPSPPLPEIEFSEIVFP
jgi:hypothetical protein